MERRIITNEHHKLIDIGYNENYFNREHWTGSTSPRIARSYIHFVEYFKTLFDKLEIQGTILDIGAGVGKCVKDFKDNGIAMDGCEYSTDGVKIAEEEFDINLKLCDLRIELPYKDDQFDFSLCSGILSMIPKQFMKIAISEILRVTKFCAFIYVATNISNQHHITTLSIEEYAVLFHECNGVSANSILPPQEFGIGVGGEFCGLWSKHKLT